MTPNRKIRSPTNNKKKRKKMRFIDLPDLLFMVIHSFVSSRPRTIENEKQHLDSYHFGDDHGDYDSVIRAESYYNRDWEEFLNTTTKFKELKKQTTSLLFSQKWSLEYCVNEEFRWYIQQQIISNSFEQLSLRFTNEFPCDAFHLCCFPLQHLQLEDIKIAIPLSTLTNVKVLELIQCSIVDEKCTLNALVVSFCSMKTPISFQKILFTNIMKIYLATYDVIHLSELGNYSTLKLLFASHRRPIAESPMDCRHIDKLYLEDPGVGPRNLVANLSSVKELFLHEAEEDVISDFFPACTNLQRLTLSVCGCPSPLPGLGQLINLHFRTCEIYKINTSLFPCLRVLTMEQCYGTIGIYLSGNCLERFLFDVSDRQSDLLELIDIQCSGLKTLSLKGISAPKPVKCVMHHFIPKVVIEDCSLDLRRSYQI
jgi:hypothetical protein